MFTVDENNNTTSTTTTELTVKGQCFHFSFIKVYGWRNNLTEFSLSDCRFPEEFSNLTEFLDKFMRFYEKVNINHTLLCQLEAY